MAATSPSEKLDVVTRLLHLGLAILAVTEWLLGLTVAGSYDEPQHTGYLVHMWLGISFTTLLLLRVLWGFVGPAAVRFVNWVPWSTARLALVWEDIRALCRLRIPPRTSHEGLAGLVQALGLLAFLWIGLTGLVISTQITPGMRLHGWPHAVKELHQVGQILIPVYLGLHVGAVLVHALQGQQLWKKMIFLE